MAENHEVRLEISSIPNIFHRKRVLDYVAKETNFTYIVPKKYKFLGVKKYVKSVSNRINAMKLNDSLTILTI